MSSFFNKNVETIKYVSNPASSAVISFDSINMNSPQPGAPSTTGSSSLGQVKMLVNSASMSFQRGASMMYFINDEPALTIGKGSGSVTLQGLFGSADQIKELCGDPSNPCSLRRNIKLSAGVLIDCDNNSNKDTAIIIYNCVVQRLDITFSIQQDGTTFQSATVVMSCTDVGTA